MQAPWWSLLITLLIASCAHDLSDHPSVPPAGVNLAPIPHAPNESPATQNTSIRKNDLLRILAEGPGAILRRLRLSPHREKSRFIGYRIGAVPQNVPFLVHGPQVGDVLLRVNGMRVLMPKDLVVLWKHLRESAQIEVDLLRGQKAVRWTIPVVE